MRFARVLVLAAAVAAVAAPEALALRFTDDSYRIPDGVVGKPFSHWFRGDGGCGPALPYQFSLLNGTLPPGVALRKDGLLSGTPTEAGSWSFWVQLSDQDPPSASWCRPSRSERSFTVRVAPAPARAGTPYVLRLGAGLEEPRTWSIVAGQLPSGLALDTADGVIAGTPKAVGSFPLQLSVVGSNGRSSAVEITIVVRRELVFSTKRLPVGRVGDRYRATVRTQGAIGQVRFAVLSGRFPVGIRLDLATGVLRGRPRAAGLYRLTIEARDSGGAIAKRTFALSVRVGSP